MRRKRVSERAPGGGATFLSKSEGRAIRLLAGLKKPRVNCSAKGIRFEREVKRYLEERGFVVGRFAASKGPGDLVAFPTNAIAAERSGLIGGPPQGLVVDDVCLIECKTGKDKPSKKFHELDVYAHKLVARRRGPGVIDWEVL